MTNLDFYKEEARALKGSFSAFDMECLYPAIKDLKKGDVYLEVGVQYGRSLDFVKRNCKADVFGIDIDDSNYQDVENANFIHKGSNEAVKNWTLPINVLFIDGDHSYRGCLDDWNNFSPFVVEGGWVFFHDCDATSPGVVDVFKDIRGWKKGKSPNPRCSMAWVQR